MVIYYLLKETEAFINPEYINFIEKIYKTCYEYIKLEFLYENESTILNYFLTNEHDKWYLNKIIASEIEELNNSINYTLGLKELNNIIKETNDDNYLNNKVIEMLSIINYPNEHRENISRLIISYINRLVSIYTKLTNKYKTSLSLNNTFEFLYDDNDHKELIMFKNDYYEYKRELEELKNTKGFLLTDETIKIEINRVIEILEEWITRIEYIENVDIKFTLKKEKKKFKFIKKNINKK